MEFPFVIVVVFVIAAIAIPFAIAQSRRTDEAWSRAARMLRLHFRSGSLFETRRITGRLQGLPVVVDTRRRGSGKNRTTYTRFRVGYGRSLGLGLRLTREGFLSGVAKTFGARDIEVGDGAFDQAFLIKGDDGRRVREFLTPSRRLRIHRLFSRCRDARVDDREIVWETHGPVRDTSRLVGTVRAMARVAWHLSGDRDEDRSLDDAIGLQGDGRAEDALAVLRAGIARRIAVRAERAVPPPLPAAGGERDRAEGAMETPPPAARGETVSATPVPGRDAGGPVPVSPAAGDEAGGDEDDGRPPPLSREEAPASEPPVSSPGSAESVDGARRSGATEALAEPVEERLLEGEILYLADRKAEARQAFERALEAAPDDEEAQGWVERTTEEVEAPGADERLSVSRPRGGSGGADDRPLDPASVCESIFSAENTSLDASRIFTERYEDRTVCWSGRLARLESYSYDFIFGNGPGMKAIVEVHELASVPYGDPVVKAVVHLGGDAAGTLGGREGEVVGFEGRLLRADGFLRNVYVADGRLAERAD